MLLVSWPTKMFHPLSTVSVKEDPGHFIVIVLTRMYQNFIVPLSQLPADCCRLDELRTRPNDGNDFHDYFITPFCVRWNFSGKFRLQGRLLFGGYKIHNLADNPALLIASEMRIHWE